MRRTVAVTSALTVSLLLAGCGDDDADNPTTPAASESAANTAPPPTQAATSDAAGPQECAQQGPYQITIISGDLGCSDAYDVADQFDTEGAAVQEIASFTCQSGTATTRPVVFTCSGGGTEFVVNEA